MKSSYFYRISPVVITLLTIAVALTSCSKDKNINAQSYIVGINVAETSAPQDFIIAGNKANIYPLAYTQTTAPVGVKPGTHQLSFMSSGTTTVNANASLTTEAGNYYSTFYLDDKSIVTLRDDQADPPSGKARVRFINLSSVVKAGVDFGTTAGNKLATSLEPKIASSYYEVNAGSTFAMYLSGATSVSLNIPASIYAGHVYTIYISGATDATLSYHLIANR